LSLSISERAEDMIDLTNVSYAYEGIAALKDVDLHIEKGEAVAFMGPNGSGKTTLLKLLNGIIFSDNGSYCLDGEEITAKRLRDNNFSKRFHQKVGFVFQNPDTQLFCANVYDEIAFGPRQMGMTESDVAKRVNDCLDLLKLQGFQDRQPYHLSEGEKRKVAIACVLALNPEVLVLDEPMNGLDPRTQRWLAQFLMELNHAGKTLLTSTHNLELVGEISRRAVLFGDTHSILADLPAETMLENADLLQQANLVDEYYHRHDGNAHRHFHVHNF